jgi:hypothetical protein
VSERECGSERERERREREKKRERERALTLMDTRGGRAETSQENEADPGQASRDSKH